ncbi:MULTISPECIES: tripartite tricarboxylate transporter substrate binding protein [Fusobacterium]|uniref:tripartite tricarboxylate transporter substrate binding protein n=1 Tax=Fusobacterium TaxID=848 RepID=UPI0014776B90|nr:MULTISPECIES: tripartite tricarboxylate transporter substrate-binding protein [Fusobacterium]NME36369.1 tripartite tricarboxylate transporter substrate binding protein [Fusobacterium sp. FSA-380-WT-3A]
MKFKLSKKLLVFSLMLGLSLTSFSAKDPGKNYPKRPVELCAPAGAGGGWDLTARTIAKVLKDEKLIKVPTPVVNRPGGGGGVNLAYMQTKKGDGQMLSIYSPPLILLHLTGTSELGYQNTTPIVGLISDYGAFVVKSDSKYKTINDVMEALKKDPKSVKVGGTSAAGSMDHIQFLLMARAAGVEKIEDIDFVSFQDSGITQILGGHVDIYSTGLSEVEGLLQTGNLRALASTAEKRVGKGVLAEVPTCKEMGIDASYINWRGVFANPDVPDYVVSYWTDVFTKMVETDGWKEALERNGWEPQFMVGEDFIKFLEEQEEASKIILEEIGMLKK